MDAKEKYTADLPKILFLLRFHWKRYVAIVLLCACLSLGVSMLMSEKYQSTVMFSVKNNKQGFNISDNLMALMGTGAATSGSVATYTEIFKTRAVIDATNEKMGITDRQDPRRISFIKNIKLENPKSTNLVNLTATYDSPQGAQQLADTVVETFKNLLTNLNQEEQEKQSEFFAGRVKVAEKEMNDSEAQMLEYMQRTKIFSLDDNAKLILNNIGNIDKRVAETKLENEASATRLSSIDAQLEKQNLSVKKYEFSDNPYVSNFKSALIGQKMALFNLEQKYTDKHPDVIQAKEAIRQTQKELDDLIDKTISSNVVGLNPIQGKLLAEKVETELALSVGQTVLSGLKDLQEKYEQNIANLSLESVNFISLDRKTKMTQVVFAALSKQYEQSRIQQAMENMDIQVIDKANLPESPVFPNKVIFIIIGVILGSMIVAANAFMVLRKQYR